MPGACQQALHRKVSIGIRYPKLSSSLEIVINGTFPHVPVSRSEALLSPCPHFFCGAQLLENNEVPGLPMEAFGKDEEGRGEFKIYDLRANPPPEQTPGKFSAMRSEQILQR